MPRYIDADALKELIEGGYDLDFDEVPETKKALLNMIDYQETIDARENVRGEWIYQSGWFGDIWVCSECGEKTTSTVMGKPRFNYCPNCGARMKGEDDAKVH